MFVVLFGPPGAGKGTQAGAVCAALGVPHVSTGDIFRKHLKEGSELGLLAKGFMSRGELVPDAVVVDIVASRLLEADADRGALLDGFPRTVRQAELLVDWLVARDKALGLVLSLEVDDAVVVGRLSGRRTCNGCGATYHVQANPPVQNGVCDRCGGEVVQRKDDAEETVLNRIQTYHRETSPVLGWLRERVPTHAIQADAPIRDVQAQLEAAMASVQGA